LELIYTIDSKERRPDGPGEREHKPEQQRLRSTARRPRIRPRRRGS
jgi:hypothetical protein